jgi:aminobenzoyl-glutamate utilization protein B
VTTNGGEAPNVVPDRASVWYYARESDARVEDMYERVVNCAKAGALATGTELTTRVYTAIHQRHANKALAELIHSNIRAVGMPDWTQDEHEFARALQRELKADERGMPGEVGRLTDASARTFVGGGSSDVGEVTLVAPTATISFPGQVPGSDSHHWSSVASNYGTTAWKGLNAGAKAIAASALDLLTTPEALAKIRAEFDAYSKDHPYKSLLPPDAEPPLDMNKDLTEKWRPKLEPHQMDPKK